MAKQVVQDIQFFAKKIMPATTEVYETQACWSKRHGHAGSNMIEKMREKAAKLGFVAQKESSSLSPDGYHANYADTIVHPDGHTIRFWSHYGVTAWENSFSATFTFATLQD